MSWNGEDLFKSALLGGGSGSGSTASVQPDWNQNDPTAADYVKNRTHYPSEIPTKILMLEPVLVNNTTDTHYKLDWSSSAIPEGKKAYIALETSGASSGIYLLVDGRNYTTSQGSIVYYGNLQLAINSGFLSTDDIMQYINESDAIDTGEIYFLTGNGELVLQNMTRQSYVSLMCEGEPEIGYQPLDERYIPYSIQRSYSDVYIPAGYSLTLESGATVNDEAGVLGKPFVVTFTRNADALLAPPSVDKTFAEIQGAIEADRHVIVKLSQSGATTYYTLMSHSHDNAVAFASVAHDPEGMNSIITSLTVDAANTVAEDIDMLTGLI